MIEKEKDELLTTLRDMYAEGRIGEVLNLLSDISETHNDPEFTLIGARAMLDASETIPDSDDMVTAAEAVLESVGEDDRNAEWFLLTGRADYLKGKYLSAYAELISAAKRNEEEGGSLPAEELEDLTKICREEVKNYSAAYKGSERLRIMRHITRYFGKISSVIMGADLLGVKEISDEFTIFPDIFVIEPSEDRKWRTFISFGAGAKKMNIPGVLRNVISERCEYVMYLPPEWAPKESLWAINLMKNIAFIPRERDSFVTTGHVFSSGQKLTDDTNLIATLLISLQDAEEGAEEVKMPDGTTLTFYQLFPLYREEFEYKLSNGYEKLIELMPDISPVFDLDRKNVCRKKGYIPPRNDVLLAPEVDYTGKLDVGVLCAVSRRIIEDGEPVGYMRRFFPDEFEPASATDSGWLFLSGKESPAALNLPYTIEIARLNTVCNIDPDIVPYLTSPCNSTFYRDKGDRFLPLDPDDPNAPPKS